MFKKVVSDSKYYISVFTCMCTLPCTFTVHIYTVYVLNCVCVWCVPIHIVIIDVPTHYICILKV